MRPAADAPGLVHAFAAGLRFDGELSFLARLPFGRTAWRRLPILETSAQASGRSAVLQAEVILTGKEPTTQALRRALRADPSDLAPGDFLVRMPELAPALVARWHPDQTLLDGAEPMCCPALACLAGSEGKRWALVTGVELEIGGNDTIARALLLLDPTLPAPWATGYNARFLLDPDLWQGLDGEVRAVGLLGLIELRRKAA
ncbi:MAG: hypothetical protein JSR41_05435 [Proteobacteria bacterium]|nr:hypothetical protein [Pseudomonadota bacterium]